MIAGIIREVSIKGKLTINQNRVIITGQHPVTFSEFTMDPPTAMLGAIKVGNDLVIEFSLEWLTTEASN
jgi:hypothetical protein